MNSYLTMAMVEQRQQDLMRAAAYSHGTDAGRRRLRKKRFLSWGLRRSPATAITASPISQCGGAS